MAKKFYITTSIAYTNAPPHAGFALELVQADVLARYHRFLGEDVFFLTGTDEHGAKVVKAAKVAGKSPREFTDEISAKFKELVKALNISNNDFIRTTDQRRHWPVVQDVWLKLKERGDLYKKNYQGLYCSGCEAFITEKDLADGKCRIHQKNPERIEEENYFFKLSKYSKKIGEIIKEDKIKIIPESRKNEISNFIKQGLEDISFSRPREDLSWAIPAPDDETASVYVWADALVNYLSALGENRGKYWPTDIHCIGKDILKFHGAIWPGMLLSLGLPVPKNIFVHGFITVEGQKMSKSLGNVIDPFKLVEKYGKDAVRYFLLREIPPTEDGDFTYEKFEQRYNADLAGGLGNLTARVVTLAGKIQNLKLKTAIQNSKLKKEISNAQKKCKKSLENFKFNESLTAIWSLISFCDAYIEREKPWRESKKQKEVIEDLIAALCKISEMLKPFLPGTSEKILKQSYSLKSEPLFPRLAID